MVKNKYQEEFDKYKDCPLPEIGEVFRHPSQYRGDMLPIEYRVIEYKNEKAVVETVHSKWKQEKTLHWVRKMYNKE